MHDHANEHQTTTLLCMLEEFLSLYSVRAASSGTVVALIATAERRTPQPALEPITRSR